MPEWMKACLDDAAAKTATNQPAPDAAPQQGENPPKTGD